MIPLIPDPRDQLTVAQERGAELRADAEAARLRSPQRTRRALAASLRRAAEKLDPAPVGWREVLR